MAEFLQIITPLLILIPIIYIMRSNRSRDVEVIYINIPLQNSKKGIIIRTVLYAYLLSMVSAILFLPRDGSGTGLFDTLLLFAIAPLPIISIVYLVYFLITRKDYRFKLGQSSLGKTPANPKIRLLGLIVIGSVFLFRSIRIHHDGGNPINYSGIGIIVTLILGRLFIKRTGRD